MSDEKKGDEKAGGKASDGGRGQAEKAAEKTIDPSSPGETGTTPGSNGK